METIRLAASKVWPMFRREAFGLDDLVQEAACRLIPKTPFENQKILYVAVKRACLSYLRDVGRKSFDRGQHTLRRLGDWDRCVYDVDTIVLDDIESGLDGRKLEVFQLRRDGMLLRDIGSVIGMTEAGVSLMLKRIIKDYNARSET